MRRARFHDDEGRLAEKVVRVKDDRRSVGLIAIDDECVGGGAVAAESCPPVAWSSAWARSGRRRCARRREKPQAVTATLTVAAMMLAAQAQHPSRSRTHEQSNQRECMRAIAARQTRGRSSQRDGTSRACIRPRRDAPSRVPMSETKGNCATATGPSKSGGSDTLRRPQRPPARR